MVLPLLGILAFAILYLAVVHWYITIPVIVIIVWYLFFYNPKDSDKKEDYSQSDYSQSDYSQSRRSQSSSYQDYSQSDYFNEGTDGYGQYYQKKSYQKKIDEKKSYHYDGDQYKKIGKVKLDRINERLEKFQITPDEARIIFGNAWTTKLGIKHRRSFYSMIGLVEVKLEHDHYNRYKKKLGQLHSKLLQIIQIIDNENEDLGGENYDYDYQNHDDSSEVNEKKITQSFQFFGLTRDSTAEQIKGKYRELSLKYHPDRNKNADTTTKMTKINSAYEIIMGAMS